MKRFSIILTGLALPFCSFAEEVAEGIDIKHITNSYYMYMSPNGQYLADKAGDAGIYNVQTGEEMFYPPASFGLGNCVSNNGVGVGDVLDAPAVFIYGQENPDEPEDELGYKLGKVIYPEALSDFWFCDIHAITPDGTKICGIVADNNEYHVMRVPFIADIDAQGNVSNVEILPYPNKDFFGATPQYCTAVWISDDGKTVAGQVTDNIGWYIVPIFYTQDSTGKWSYTMPSKSLFNPEGIEIPENPFSTEPKYPEAQSFMTGNALSAYQEAYQLYAMGAGPMPNPLDYMDDDEKAAYQKALDEYDEWEEKSANLQYAFFKAYDEIMMTSPTFSQNELTLHPNGDYMMMHGGKINEQGDMDGLIYKFGIKTESIEEINPPVPSASPTKILPNGLLVVTTPKMEWPTSWFQLPGQSEFLTMEEYFESFAPSVSEFYKDQLPAGSGVVCLSNDMKTFSSAVMPIQQGSNYDEDKVNYFYSTFLIQLAEAGIESVIADPEDGVYKVYNLQGVKVLETKNPSEVNALGKGLYIINGKKILF